MSDIRFINISGFHNSGSSSVVNLLKEYRGFYEGEAEMRLIKDPYGLAHLERELTEDYWGLINSSAAVSDFLEYAKKCARYGKALFSPAGLSYSKYVNPNFIQITNSFIDRIVDYKYKTDYYHYKFKKPYLKYVSDRLRNGLDRKFKGRLGITNNNIETCYFAHPTKERFDEAVRWYIDELYSYKVAEKGCNNIILDQAISPNNTKVMHRFFSNAKLIIVKRDPRDMYMNDIQRGFSYVGTREDGIHYAMRQKALRGNIQVDEDIMIVQFEDMVIESQLMTKKVEDFLNIDPKDHIQPGKFFNIERSRQNVGLWKIADTKYCEALQAIKEFVPEMCIE